MHVWLGDKLNGCHAVITVHCAAGQMCEDSIQELNNLIGELDSFQKEHEMKMQQKEREKHQKVNQTTLTASSIGDISDTQSNFDKLSINSNDPNPLMCSTAHLSESDVVDSASDLAVDCQATTKSLKLNLSTTEHPLFMHSISLNGKCGSSSTSSSNHSGDNETKIIGRNIEIIPESYNVSDNYVKQHTEIVVLRRKDSISETSNSNSSTKYCNGDSNGVDVVEHAPINRQNSAQHRSSDFGSFRCSSFSAKTDHPAYNHLNSQQISPIAQINVNSSGFDCNDLTNGTAVMHMQYDPNLIDHMECDGNAAMQMIRKKPSITPRPASLSGLFVQFFF